MTEIDERIVSMEFNNANFERKMSETIRSLDKLRASLDFANSKRGLDELATAGNNFQMNSMADSVEGIAGKFKALSIVGITALATITNKAVEAGIQLVKSLSFDQIKSGFADYNEKLTSVQTIMNATGKPIQEVSGYFDQLDTYADKTIYNLKDMTSSFAKFTNAGLDMKTSIPAIKGIANMVALAGQGSEAASIAMYNLSQSLAGGFLTTIDYKSLNLANVATKEWKNQMIAGAVAAGTLQKAADGTYQVLGADKTFKGAYTDAALFTEALSEGWATTGVLTKVLGDYGNETTVIGKKALAAAQDVKSLPMMIETLKASVGTGWTQTFEILLGNVEESKQLFTGLTTSIQGFLDKIGNSRNELLKEWKELGGRTALIEGLKNAFHVIAEPLERIGKAFREIFPPMTAERLVEITKSFENFMKSLIPGAETLDKIQRIFAGVFAAFEIGFTILKEVVKTIFAVFGSLSSAVAGGGDVLEFLASMADWLVKLNASLVEGGKIYDFFFNLRIHIQEAGLFLRDFKENVIDFFTGAFVTDTVEKSVERIGDRAQMVSDVWGRMLDRFSGVFEVLDKAWNIISTWFQELGQKIAEAFHPGDFDAAVDLVNVGLLGGIVILLKKFVKNGINVDLFKSISDKINGAFGQLTNTLKAMQTNLKAQALMRIAIAVGVLTASIVVLSLIDSEKLTKALIAIGIGFGQLVAVMTLMDKLGGSAVKTNALAASLILMSVAIGVLSLAIKNLSDLDLGELAKGLTGVGVGLGILVVGIKFITTDTAGLISAGIAMTAISVALLILSEAVKSFADMSWSDMGKGLVGVAAGLLLVTTAMNFMPPTSVLSGLGFAAIAVGLNIMAGALKILATIEIGDLAKGLGAIAIGLGLITAAMNLMPITTPIIAYGVLILSKAIVVLAAAMLVMGMADIETIAKGLGALAGMLTILVVAMNLMNSAVLGATSLVIVAGALSILSGVLLVLGNMSIAEIATGLGAIAAVMLILGVAAQLLEPVIPALLGVGIALGLIGASFALFGTGVMLVAKAFKILAESGAAGAKAIIEIIKVFVTARFEIAKAIAGSIIGLIQELVGALPLLTRLIEAVLLQLLETIVKLVPEIAKAISAIVLQALSLIRDLYPAIFGTGLYILLKFLEGIKQNIGQIITVGTDIIVAFAQAIVTQMPRLVGAAFLILTGFLFEIGNHVDMLVNAGFKLLTDILFGIANNLIKVIELAGTIITTLITTIGDTATDLATAGFEALLDILGGISDNIGKVIDKGVEITIKLIEGIGSNSVKLANAAAQALVDFLNGMADAIDKYAPEIREAGARVGFAIVDGISGGMLGKAGDVAKGAFDLGKKGVGAFGRAVGFDSPAKEFIKIGKGMAEGVVVALRNDTSVENSAIGLANKAIDSFNGSLSRIPDSLAGMDNFNPVITPVLDLTKVQVASSEIAKYMKVSSISPDVSFDNASEIARAAELNRTADAVVSETGVNQITFEQNNYSPEALSANDIYRNTKSQIVLAKEELGIS